MWVGKHASVEGKGGGGWKETTALLSQGKARENKMMQNKDEAKMYKEKRIVVT